MTLDPGEHDISELGPKINKIDDVEELREILQAEKDGENRDPVVTVVENRIEKLEEEPEEVDVSEMDPSEMTVAELGNAISNAEDADALRGLLEREEAGEDRKSAKRLINNRIENVEGSEEQEQAAAQSPEEKYPELDHPTADKRHVRALDDGTYGDMWVYCETQAGDLVDVSLEMLGKARELMDQYNEDYGEEEKVVAVLIGDDVEKHTETCIEYGADVVVYHEDDRLSRFQHKPYTEIFCDMSRWGGDPREDVRATETDWRDYDEPRYTVFPATNNGRDLSALVQAELDSGLASDCSGLYIENTVISNPVKTGNPGENKEFERVLHMKRPDFSGFEYSTILCLDNPGREFHPQGASVIPGSFEVPDPDPERQGEVVEHTFDLEDDWFRVDVTEYDQLEGGIDHLRDVVVHDSLGLADELEQSMMSVEQVCGVHHIHVWRLDERSNLLESHVVIEKEDLNEMEDIKASLKKILHDEYGINHSTLEFEIEPCGSPRHEIAHIHKHDH